MRPVFDVVLIDCPPGLSVLTECWLREADFHLSPTKPDYVSVCGLEVFRRFKALNPEMGFAENIGVARQHEGQAVAVGRGISPLAARRTRENRCFEQAVPRSNALQDAARFSHPAALVLGEVSGEAGVAVKALAKEVLARLDMANVGTAGIGDRGAVERGAADSSARERTPRDARPRGLHRPVHQPAHISRDVERKLERAKGFEPSTLTLAT